ncbi:hypothetical protein pVco7_gp024 [Vibrio phage pVco-7]|uniref:Uncharacterized protein n=1 Tax=Vibrio phage pVco-5 TaxID=1965485 RepID=A0A1W6JUT0_9CAUD|nr:hypothetical protein KNT61_gp024 [Vibrio phage pVco-5]ARM71012.1 hypothetical protein pVco5_024 [Vibrio phage pVco-5]
MQVVPAVTSKYKSTTIKFIYMDVIVFMDFEEGYASMSNFNTYYVRTIKLR